MHNDANRIIEESWTHLRQVLSNLVLTDEEREYVDTVAIEVIEFMMNRLGDFNTKHKDSLRGVIIACALASIVGAHDWRELLQRDSSEM